MGIVINMFGRWFGGNRTCGCHRRGQLSQIVTMVNYSELLYNQIQLRSQWGSGYIHFEEETMGIHGPYLLDQSFTTDTLL